MHLEAVIELVWKCIWRPRSSNAEMHLEAEIKLNSAMDLEAEMKLNSEMYLEAKIKLNSEMPLEAMIERLWRCIWRPQSCNPEMHLEAVIE
jgi:hypothetical protein